ncbi:putative MFS toxin efflux pump [Aspergillus udagawae]|uniref:MFS toxin efflux pump n=1 Tax=Aspergillus udagawae TaxID=91492 RepID=A0ABQ1B9T6_9EURO|nr:putative MFS toxin efflux pump [Aspergillus udagawae]
MKGLQDASFAFRSFKATFVQNYYFVGYVFDTHLSATLTLFWNQRDNAKKAHGVTGSSHAKVAFHEPGPKLNFCEDASSAIQTSLPIGGPDDVPNDQSKTRLLTLEFSDRNDNHEERDVIGTYPQGGSSRQLCLGCVLRVS